MGAWSESGLWCGRDPKGHLSALINCGEVAIDTCRGGEPADYHVLVVAKTLVAVFASDDAAQVAGREPGALPN